MNRTQWLSVWGFALGAAANPYAAAQSRVEPPEQPIVQRSGAGIDYISGGAGEDDRESMAARQGEFPFTVVMSVPNGELAVADRLSVLTPQGSLHRVGGPRERGVDGVPHGLEYRAVRQMHRLKQEVVVAPHGAPVLIGVFVEQQCGALHVGEEEGDDALREVTHERRRFAPQCTQPVRRTAGRSRSAARPRARPPLPIAHAMVREPASDLTVVP